MAIYLFKNKETDEVTEVWMKISERDQYLEENPHLEQVLTVPKFKYNNAGKPEEGFRDVLREMKKAHPRGNVNTFD